MKKICRHIFIGRLFLFVSVICGLNVHGQTTTIAGTVNIYTPVTGIDSLTCPATITVGSVAGFSVGNKVLIIQMKGCDFDSSSGSTFGNITNIKGAGNYEISVITAISGNVISLNGQLLKTYNLNGFVQLVKIASYITASVGTQLSCPPWNGSTGGVLIIDVMGNLSLGADIDVSGKGFRGGVISNNPDGGCGNGSTGYYYPLVQGGSSWSTGGAQKGEGIGTIAATKQAGRGALVSGGGGGNKHNTGGGGGSNFTAGGKGGNELSGCSTSTTGGIGGNALDSYYGVDKLFMGGGGGRGDDNNLVGTLGAAGGGIAIIMCGSISGNSLNIKANGNHVTAIAGSAADGAGGGGGGGMVFLQTTAVLSNFTVQANGGNGGSQNPSGYCAGPGGGGGTGTFLSSLSSLGGIVWSLNPGAAGIMIGGSSSCINTTYGATPGFTNSIGPLTSRNLVLTPTINPNIILTAVSSSSLLCTGKSATITASGASTYTWLPSLQTGSVLIISPASTTNYTLQGSLGTGCTNSITVTQSVNPTPTITATSSGSVCAGGSATLSAFGGSSYTWTPGALTGTSITFSATSNSIYSVTGLNNGCTGTTSILQTVNANPTVSINPFTLLVCPSVNFSLSAAGANTYSWLPSGTTGTSLNTSINASTIFTVIGTSVAGCKSSATSTVQVKPTPTLSFNTFSITCGSLGSATVSANGGIGPFTYTWTPTLQTTSAVANLFPGNYSVVVSDNGTGCVVTRTTNFAPLIPLSGTVSSSAALPCNNIPTGTAAIVLSGGSGSQSYTWTSANGIQNTSTVSNLAAGVNTVTVIDGLTFCTVTKTFNITQPPALSITVTQSSPSVCLGGIISYTALASGGTPAYTFSWVSFPGGTSMTAGESISGPYIYTIGITDANLCVTQKTVSGLFVPNPVITAPTVTICPLETAVLTASGATTYFWNTNFSGNPLLISPITATQYTVTGSTAGCSGSATASVFLKPGPTAAFTGTTAICQDDSLKLMGLGGNTYAWITPQNVISPNQNYVLASAQPSNGGTYTLQVTASNSCSSKMAIPVMVYGKPALVASGSTVCAGSALYLNANYLSGVSYSWTGHQGFSSSQQSPQIPNATSAMTGTYMVLATSIQGCTRVATVSSSVVTAPPLFITGDSMVCFNNSLNLQANGGGSYTWMGPNLFYSLLPTATITNVQLFASGVYTLISKFGPCTTLAFKTVTVLPLPLPVATAASPVCENNYLQLGASGASSYTWKFPNGSVVQGGNQNAGPVTASFAGNYTLIARDGFGCEAKTTVAVQVLESPMITAANVTACAGGLATLSAQGGLIYNWTGPLNFSVNGAIITIPVVNAATAGVYTVAATGTNVCVGTTTILVSAMSYVLPNVTAGVSPKICLGGNINLQGGGGDTYEWKGPGGFISMNKDPVFTANDFSMTGIYTLTARNASNCSASATVNVKILPLPKGIISATNTEGCVPLCAGFKVFPVFPSTGFVNEVYFIGDEMANAAGNFKCFNEPGLYQIRASFTDSSGCANSMTINVSAFENPKADFYYSPPNPVAGIDQVHFYNTSSGNNINSYSWFLNSNEADTITERNPIYVYEGSGKYAAVLLVKNAHGCVDTVIKPILVEDEFNLYVPNAFSPNGDGLNDLFLPKGGGIRSYHLRIFNRWGQLLFNSRDIQNAWDGTSQGELCKVDSYIWTITIVDASGKTKDLTGHVSIVK